MVDLTFMAKVLGVLPDDAQLVVLGDTPQLASIQPGAVFADVCRDGTGSAGTVTDASTGTETGSRAGPGGHSVGTAYGALADCGIELTEAGDAAAPVSSPLVSCVVRLVRNWRFNEAGGIGRLAAAVVRGDASAAVAALRDTSDDATELRAFTAFPTASSGSRRCSLTNDLHRCLRRRRQCANPATPPCRCRRFVSCEHTGSARTAQTD